MQMFCWNMDGDPCSSRYGPSAQQHPPHQVQPTREGGKGSGKRSVCHIEHTRLILAFIVVSLAKAVMESNLPQSAVATGLPLWVRKKMKRCQRVDGGTHTQIVPTCASKPCSGQDGVDVQAGHPQQGGCTRGRVDAAHQIHQQSLRPHSPSLCRQR